MAEQSARDLAATDALVARAQRGLRASRDRRGERDAEIIRDLAVEGLQAMDVIAVELRRLAVLETQAADAQAQLLLNNAEPPEQVKDSLREAHGMATYAELADRAVRFEEALQQIERPMPDPDADWTTVAPWRKVNNRRRDIARDALEGVKVDG